MNGNMTGNDTSGFIYDPHPDFNNHLGKMTSDVFSDITPLHTDGEGPFSIYRATRRGKRFTLKCLAPKYQDDPVFSIVQEKECDIGAALDHINIRSTIGLENVTGLGRSIILEYVDGEPLDMAIQHGRITRQNVRRIAAQIAEALEYIHSKQTLHGDIKPSNILITFNGARPKLIDFSLSDTEAYVSLKNPGGTKRYLAPEMLLAGAAPSAKADIYSFGILARDLAELTGDKALLKAAKECCHDNPEKRSGLSSIIRLSEDADTGVFRNGTWSLGSSALTHILMLLAAGMAVIISVMAYSRFVSHDDAATRTATESPNIQVVDMDHTQQTN